MDDKTIDQLNDDLLQLEYDLFNSVISSIESSKFSIYKKNILEGLRLMIEQENS